MGDLDHVFLVNHHAEGFVQNRFQLRVQVRDGLPAVVAVDERLHHAAVRDAGTDDGAGRGQHLERLHAQLLKQVAHARRLDIETADGASLPHQRTGLRIGHGIGAIKINRNTVMLPHVPHRVRQHRQAHLCQQVDLQQAHVLHRIHVVLGDGEPFRRFLERNEIGDGHGTDDDAAAVNRQMAREPLDAPAQLNDGSVRLVFHRRGAGARL